MASVAKVLKPGARFMSTAPTRIETWRDMNTGIECPSLGCKRYEEILEKTGLEVIVTNRDDGRNNYYEAERFGQQCHGEDEHFIQN